MVRIGRNGAMAAALALALLAGLWYRVAVPGGATPAAAGSAAPSYAPAPAVAAGTGDAGAGQWQLPGLDVPVEPFAQRLQRLSTSGDARQAFEAYRLVRACLAVRSSGATHPSMALDDDPLARIADRAGFCEGVTERMRMDAIALLERAAHAGVDGAMVALVEEGPFGDPSALLTRPDDPLVKEWKERVNRMLGEQAGKGEWASLYLLFTGFTFGNPAVAVDRQSALAYGLALRDIVVKGDGMTEDEAIPFNGPFLDQVRAGLSREQQEQASAQAAAIVDVALRQRAHSAQHAGNTGA